MTAREPTIVTSIAEPADAPVADVGADDLALVSSKWRLSGTGPDGKPVTMNATSTDVMRRQADGSWKVAIDNPYGV